MATPVFLTIDTEFAWRHHAAGLDVDTIYARSLEPAGVGIGYQLATLARFGLKACFFVDPMPALVHGLSPIRRMVDTILAAGQEVQLHCHPHWTGASDGDRAIHDYPQLFGYPLERQTMLIAQARDLLIAAGAPRPIAFRAGNYAANADTLRALAALGMTYDSSHNAAQRDSRIGLAGSPIAPAAASVIEVPVTVIADAPGVLRTVQLCALSSVESRAALDHAAAAGHAAVTIVSHSFELANRAGTRANAVHVRRFVQLCRALADRAAVLPTVHFADRPHLSLGQDDAPLRASRVRRGLRQAEQAWSNWISERAA